MFNWEERWPLEAHLTCLTKKLLNNTSHKEVKWEVFSLRHDPITLAPDACDKWIKLGDREVESKSIAHMDVRIYTPTKDLALVYNHHQMMHFFVFVFVFVFWSCIWGRRAYFSYLTSLDIYLSGMWFGVIVITETKQTW